ncbi:MAG TPA: serine/threonine-protein kinase [Kribbella sp.]
MRRRLGSGGFATVWLAYDEQLDAEVAVKVLADNWAHDDSVRHRFLEEGRFLRRVESEHVVQVHDVGELEDGRPFLVLTYADRGTLADRLNKEPLGLEPAVGVIVQVGRGLQALHRRGLLHRDVKPANVLFRSTDEGERAVLSDLGLGKSLDEVSRITLPGGTPSYVAPEQALGDRLDQRADQYSLGAVAYAALTGRSPHQVDGLGAAGRVEAAPPPSSLGFDVPDRVDAAIVRALDPDREKRWPDVASFTRELVGALDETTHSFIRSGVAMAPTEPGTTAAVAAATKATNSIGAGETGTVDASGEKTALSDANAPTIVKLPADVSTEPAPAGPSAATAATAADRKSETRPRRRRGRWVVAALLALILGGGAGFGAERYLQPRQLVDISRGDFSLRVPKSMAGVIVQSNWRPPGASSDQPAIRVSKNDDWSTPGRQTPGVFVGVMAKGTDIRALLPSADAYGCGKVGEVTEIDQDGMKRVDRISSGCSGGSTMLQRVTVSSSGGPLLVQVQVPDSDGAKIVDMANSVSYSGPTNP